MDIRLNFTERGVGNGSVLLLLHGNGESSAYFTAQLEYFAAQYHVMAIDTRGHGGSPRGNREFTIKQFADDLLAFMDRRAVDKVDILGFSDGANIALTFALAHPERIRRLVLNGANLFPSGLKRSVALPIELGYKSARLMSSFSRKAKTKAELLALMVNEPNINPQELSRLSIPVLVIAGTNDMIKTAHTKLIADSIPRAELVLIKGDHFIASKAPLEFNRAVEKFLRKQ